MTVFDKAGGGTRTDGIDWDGWRAHYRAGSTVAWERDFYRDVVPLYPQQRSGTIGRVAEFVDLHRPLLVCDLGGWDGWMAESLLPDRSWIGLWTVLELAPVPPLPSLAHEPRYEHVLLDRWPWEDCWSADVLIASHVFEHLLIRDVEAFLAASRFDSVYVEAPIPRDRPTDWAGYSGTHIFEGTFDDLVRIVDQAGYFCHVDGSDVFTAVRRGGV